MSLRYLNRTAAVAACASLTLFAGCVVAPVGSYGYGEYAEVVGVAPPPPRYEVIGVAPVLGHVWINGYWGWSGGRHHWVNGRWAAPRPGHAWVPHAWGRAGSGWRLNPGYWRRH
jgi:WXXGXW repeat (2 copies)